MKHMTTARASVVALALVASFASGAAAQEFELSTPDAEGRRTITVPMNTVHQLVPGKDFTRDLKFRAPQGYRISEVRSFIGVDRSDRVEAAVHVSAGTFLVYARSMHKETDTNYDAWSVTPTKFAFPEYCVVGVSVLGRTTTDRKANILFGVVIVIEPR